MYVTIRAQFGASCGFIFDSRGCLARKFPVPNPKIQDAKPENKSCSARKLLILQKPNFTQVNCKKLTCPKIEVLCPKIRPVLAENV